MKRLSEDGYIRVLERKLHNCRAVTVMLLAAPWVVMAIFILIAAASLFSCDLNPDDWKRMDASFVRLELRDREPMERGRKTYLVTEEGTYFAYRTTNELRKNGLEAVAPGTRLELVLYNEGLTFVEKERLAGVYAEGKTYCSIEHTLWWQWFDFWFALLSIVVMITTGVVINVLSVTKWLKGMYETKRDIEQRIARRREKIDLRRPSVS